MGKQDKAEVGGLLLRDKEYVRYVQLLKKAESEGRLDGQFTCRLCGMKFHSVEEAESCCRGAVA